MLGFMWWLVVGLVAGLLARFIIPGEGPLSWLLTVGLALVGSVTGGFVSSQVYDTYPMHPGFHTGGLIMAAMGAVFVLGVYFAYVQRSET
jgi:uncharacterized membrane protein YeaQ/YmgE (transglycosylase-associated protein family)